ncbi:MAG: TlyA family RNA methyltransferase [Micrococcus sp.]|nr:TlyA family RNA methyltransferase [Micrococcus sp.]
MTQRADRAAAERRLARSRTEAVALIQAGALLLNGRPVTKASHPVAPDDDLRLNQPGPRYVSRAAHKLVSALDAFDDVAVQGVRALDAGASTGGFTQVLLERGAAEVAAVDVGHGQLVGSLRSDPRVLVREGLNIRDLTPHDIDGPVQLVVGDLSFISLTLVLERLSQVCLPGADLMLMVKPQFEVGRHRLPKTGVVTDPHARRDAVLSVLEAAHAQGLQRCGVARSGLEGQDGNAEFFLHLRRDTDTSRPAADPGHAQDDGAWLDAQSVDWN